MHEPLLSVVVPVYNGKRFIRDTLASLARLEAVIPCEFIFQNSCSTDGTTEILDSFCQGRQNRLHFNEQDNGQSEATNSGMTRARGRRVTWLGADDLTLSNIAPYAASKKAAETLSYTYHYLHGIDVSVVRYFTIYGPAGRPDLAIFRFVQWVEEGRPIVLYGDGSQERDFTYIDDIVRGTLAALKPLGFEVINLGSDRPVAMSEMIRMIERLAGKSAVIDRRPEAPGDVRATWADIGKAGRLLGWEPRIGLEDGLRACLEWYRAEREWARSSATSD